MDASEYIRQDGGTASQSDPIKTHLSGNGCNEGSQVRFAFH